MSEEQQPSTEERGRVPECAIPSQHSPRPRFNVTKLFVVLGLVIFVFYTVSSILGSFLEKENRIACALSLRTIGEACRSHAEGNQGRFPADLAQLIQDGSLSSTICICSSTSHEHATGNTMAEILANFAKPGHCSYVYVGNGLTLGSPADAVVAYDMVTNHEQEGINVLYVDGHVDWLNRKETAAVIAELDAGHNPPRQSVLASATQPTTR